MLYNYTFTFFYSIINIHFNFILNGNICIYIIYVRVYCLHNIIVYIFYTYWVYLVRDIQNIQCKVIIIAYDIINIKLYKIENNINRLISTYLHKSIFYLMTYMEKNIDRRLDKQL